MTALIDSAVDTSVVPDYSMIRLNGRAWPENDAALFRDAIPAPGTVAFGPFFAVVHTTALRPKVRMEWWNGEPPAGDTPLRGEDVIAVPDGFVSVSTTTSGYLGQVQLAVPADRAHVRVAVSVSGEVETLLVQLWPA